MSGNPRCQKPFFLKEIPIQDVAIQDFTCEGEEAGGRAEGQELGRQETYERGEVQQGTSGQDALRSDTALPSGMQVWL